VWDLQSNLFARPHPHTFSWPGPPWSTRRSTSTEGIKAHGTKQLQL
jgi:hypothetical protein